MSYKRKVQRVQADVSGKSGSLKIDKETRALNALALKYTTQGIAQANQNNHMILDTVSHYAEAEAKQISMLHGEVQAQKDKSIIDGYQNSIRQSQEQMELLKGQAPADMGGMDETGEYANHQMKMQSTQSDIIKAENNIKELLTPGRPYNISDVVRIENLQKTYLMQVDINSTNTINSLIEKFKFDPITFERQAKKLEEGKSAVPDRFKTNFTDMLRGKIADGKAIVQKNFNRQADDQYAAKTNEFLTITSNGISTNARRGLNTSEDMIKYKEAIADKVEKGIISNVKGKADIRRVEITRDTEKVMFGYDEIANRSTMPQNIPADIKTYAKKFMAEDWSSTMDETLKRTLYGNMMSQATALENVFKAHATAKMDSDIALVKDAFKRVKAGEDFSAEQLDGIGEIAHTVGEWQKWVPIKAVYDSVKALDKMPYNAQKDQLFAATSEINVKLDDINTMNKGEWSKEELLEKFAYNSVIEAMEDRIAKNEKSVKADINSYLMRNKPIFNGEVFDTGDITGIDVDENYTKNTLNIIKNRWDNRYNIKAQFGEMYESVSTKEAAELNRVFSQKDKDGRVEFLQGLSKNVGVPESLNIIGKMWKDNQSTELLAAGLAAYGDKIGANVMFVGLDIQRMDNFAKPDKTFKDDSKLAYEQNIGLVMDHLTTSSKNLYHKSIMDHYYGSQVPGSQEEFDEGQYDKSVEAVTNGSIEFNGKKIFAPQKGYSEVQMDEFMMAVIQPRDDFFERTSKLPMNFENWDEVKDLIRRAEYNNNVFLHSVGRGKYTVSTKSIGKNGIMQMNRLMQDKNTPFILDMYQTDEASSESPKFIGN